MGIRPVILAEGEFYHVYNRGVDHRPVVCDEYDADRFVNCLDTFNDTNLTGSIYALSFEEDRARGEQLVDIVAYCLNPNHFHLILKQKLPQGIQKFMHRLSGGYAWYFNSKYKRSGSLWQGRFNAKHIQDNQYLLHVSAYVNLNDKVHRLSGPAAKYVRSSWDEYKNNYGFCQKTIILSQFPDKSGYIDFATTTLPAMLDKRKDYEELKH